MLNVSQKERQLLQDQKKHEQVCIDKYNSYSNQAQDPQLKNLFKSYAGQEQKHLDSINQMLNGQVPAMSQGTQQQGGSQSTMSQGTQQQSGSQSAMSQGTQQQNISQSAMSQGAMTSQADSMLCNDMLMTEKYVSGAYDTAIFEFTDSNVRQALNHIQKEEQQHGEGIFNYMQSNGMYSPQ